MKSALHIALYLGAFSVFAQDTHMQTRLKELTELLDKKRVEYGLVVAKADSGVIVFEKNPNQMLNPASNVKLYTIATALDNLKSEYRFKTEYYATGPIEKGVLKGDLVVKGYGDPTVVTERLQVVVNELKLLGVKSISGALVADESYFDSQNWPRGYLGDESPERAYAAPIGALSFNHNCIAIYVRPSEAGEDAFVALDPPVDGISLSARVKTDQKPTDVAIQMQSKSNKLTAIVSGHVQSSDAPKRYYRRIEDPALYFLSALQVFLTEKGIGTSGVMKKGGLPANSKLVYTDYSPMLSVIIQDIMKFSNNFMSEMLVKALGAQVSLPATFANGLKQITQFADEKVGLKKSKYNIGNGSGLNDANRLSAKQLTDILLYMQRQFEFSPEFKGSLCIAGITGTVKRRLSNSAAKGRLRAKTGTLTGVSSLSGYAMSDKEGELVFALVMNKRSMSLDEFWVFERQLADILSGERISETAKQIETNEGQSGEDEQGVL